MRNNKWIPVLLLTIMGVLLAVVGITATKGKTKKVVTAKPKEQETTVEYSAAEINLADPVLGIIKSIDRSDGSLVMYQMAKMEEAELYSDNLTAVTNKYGDNISIKQLKAGDIVTTVCERGTNKLYSVAKSADAWAYKGIRQIDINKVDYIIGLGDREYQFDSHLLVYGKDGLITLDDLSEKDILTAVGIDEKIYGLIVTRGHGNITFSNYKDFVGGSIEIGYDIFGLISNDMEFVVREGSYKLVMKKGSLAVNKYITVESGQTVNVDLNEYRNSVDKTGLVAFDITPADSEVYIDGILTDVSVPVELSYGEYVLEVIKDTYETCNRLLTVSKPTVSIKIDLADNNKNNNNDSLSKLDDFKKPVQDLGGDDDIDEYIDVIDDEDEGSEWLDYSSDEEPVAVEGQYIYIRKPEGATVSMDGKELGIVPIQIKKVTGEHEILFTKDGFITKTYIVEIENDGEDVVFSFPDLTAQ